MVKLYKKNGTLIMTLEEVPTGSLVHRELMGDHYVKLVFSTSSPIYFEIGDYVDIDGFGHFELSEPYMPKYNSETLGYDYTIQFDAYYIKWKNKIVKYDPAVGASETSFKLTSTIDVHLGRIVANINALGDIDNNYRYPPLTTLEGDAHLFTFDYTTFPAPNLNTSKYKQYDNTDLISALNDLAQIYECEWWVEGNTIYFGRCENGTAVDFEIDVNVGEMTSSESKKAYANRLYAFGSTRNLHENYRRELDNPFHVASVKTIYDSKVQFTCDGPVQSAPASHYSVTRSQQGQYNVFYITNTDSVPHSFEYELNVRGYIITDVVSLAAGETSSAIMEDELGVEIQVTIEYTGQGSFSDWYSYNNSLTILNGIYAGKTVTFTVVSGTYTEESWVSPVFEIDLGLYSGDNSSFQNVSVRFNTYGSVQEKMETTISSSSRDSFKAFGFSDIVLGSDAVTENSVMTYNNTSKTLIRLGLVKNYNGTLISESDLYKWGEEGATISSGAVVTLSGLMLSRISKQYTRSIVPEDSDVVQQGVVQKRLMLPLTGEHACPHGYVQDDAAVTVNGVTDETKVIESVIVLEECFPKTTFTVGSVSSSVDSDGMTSYKITEKNSTALPPLLENTSNPRIIFQSGKLNGMDFECKLNGDRTEYTIITNEDYGRPLPDVNLYPSADDTFVAYGFDADLLGGSLISAAENDLYSKAVEVLNNLKKDSNTYNCTMMSDWYDEQMEETDGFINYNLGQRVMLINSAFFASGRASRVIGYEINLDFIYDKPKYIVGEATTYSKFSDLQNQIDSLIVSGASMQPKTTGVPVGGGSGTLQYIGTTKTQESPQAQSLTGIESVQFSTPSAGEMGLEVITQSGKRTLHTTMPLKTEGKVEGKSLQVGTNGEYGIKQSGDATLHDAEFTGDVQTDNFQDVAGQVVGAQITHAGKITASAIKALSFEIFELIYNRIRTTGGRQSFTSAAGTVDNVTLVSNSNGIYRLDMHSDEDRADGDKTEFQVGDIFYSYVNHVNNRGYSQGGQCWMHVTEVNTSGTNNYILAQMYGSPDTTADVSGVHTRYNNAYTYNNTTHYLPSAYNLVPEDGMVITHWGNISNTDRQTTFYVDCEDGNILQLMGVDEPQISYTNGNYGSIVGKLPQQLIDAVRTKTGYVLNPNQPYIYARGLVAQDFIQLDYQGKIIRTENNRGEWSYATASGDSPYMSTATYYDAVSYNGCLYMCVQSGTTSAPGIDGTWMLINGSGLKVYGLLVDPNAINIKTNGTITPSTTISAKVKKLVANKPMELLSLQSEIEDEGLRVEYSFDSSVWAEFTIGVNGILSTEGGLHIVTEDQDPSPIVLEGGGLDISSLPSDARLSVRLVRESDDEVIDTLDIPVTKNGEKGDEGTTFSVKGEAYIDPNSTHTWAVGEFKYNPSATPSSAITICTATGTPPTWTSVTVTEGDAYILRDTTSAGHMIYYNGTIWVDLGNITGRGISSITINYAVNNDSANAPTSGWSTTRGEINETNPFLWQRVKTNYTDGSSSDWSQPVLIGSYGRDAYSLDVSMPVIPVMVEDTSTANVYKVLSSISGNVNIKLMKGGTQQSITSSNVSVTPDITMSGSYNYFSISVVSNVLIIHYSLSANSTYLIPNTFTATITVNGVSLSTSVAVAKSQRGTAGPMGDTGPLMYPAGVYDEATAKRGYSDANGYINDGASTPYVYYIAPNAEEGNYYYRTQDKYHSASGAVIDDPTAPGAANPADPATEYQFDNPAWRIITKYESVWAKILFANFGRLSEFVFWGDWMFSEMGYEVGSSTLTTYAAYSAQDLFDANGKWKGTTWMPVYYANAKTGETKFGNARVEGLVTERFAEIAEDEPFVVRFDANNAHHASFEKHNHPKAFLLPLLEDVNGIVYDHNGSSAITGGMTAFDGEGVSVRVVNQAISWLNDSPTYNDLAEESILLCADPRMFVPSSYDVVNLETKYAPKGTYGNPKNINPDYDGYFVWNGIYAKFILLPPGYMVRLTALDNYNPSANNNSGAYYRYWFVEGAFDLASVGLRMLIEVGKASPYNEYYEAAAPGPHHASSANHILAPSWMMGGDVSDLTDPMISIDLVNGGIEMYDFDAV